MNFFILRARANHEIETAASLMEDGWQSFCPIVLRTYKNRYRKVREWKAYPRFSGYILFGYLTDQIPWRELKLTNKILGLLGTSAGPSIVPPVVVEQLIAENGRKEEQVKTIDVGDLVQVKSGPLIDLVFGRVDEIGSSRARVSFGSISASVRINDLVPAQV